MTVDPDTIVEEERSVCSPSPISPGPGLSPMTPASHVGLADKATIVGTDDQASVIQALQGQIVSARKAWQQHIWELEGQVRDLKAEVEDLRMADYCASCGRGCKHEEKHHSSNSSDARKGSVVDRPRARTGDAARFGNGK